MPDCVFCKIVAGSIPVQKVYEDDKVVAFPDAHPKAPGHTLVIPKEHYRWFYQMPDDLYDQVFRISKKITKDLAAEHKTEYVRLNIMGDEVAHVHVHLIPQSL